MAALAQDRGPVLAPADEEAMARAQAVAALAEMRQASLVEAVSRVAQGFAAQGPTALDGPARPAETPDALGPGTPRTGMPPGDPPAAGQAPAPGASRFDVRV